MKVVCLGDSLTYGYGVRRAHTWVSLLAKNSSFEMLNKGVNGDTTGGMSARFESDVIKEQAKKVLLIGGTNDAILSGTLDIAKSNIASMAQRAMHERIVPMIGAPFPLIPSMIPDTWKRMADMEMVQKELMAYREWLHLYSEVFQISFIDCHSILMEEADMSSYYLDGIHLNEKGHQLMAERLLEQMHRK